MTACSSPRHLEILAHLPLADVRTIYDRITKERVFKSGDCLLSTRALQDEGTKYPVLTYTVTLPSGVSKKLKLYAHHVVMLWKLKLEDPRLDKAWAPELHVSHNCHNTRCVQIEHLALVSQADNNSRNIHCIGVVICKHCNRRMQVCVHQPPCLIIQAATCIPNCSIASVVQ